MDVDADAFPARPLTARPATNGPTVRPVRFRWEDGAFRMLTGPWSRLRERFDAGERETPAAATPLPDRLGEYP